jgi:hypothetical protein
LERVGCGEVGVWYCVVVMVMVMVKVVRGVEKVEERRTRGRVNNSK